MSKIMDFCEEVKTKIEAVSALDGVPVIISRQQDMLAEIENEVARMNAAIALYPVASPRPRDPQPGDPYNLTIEIEAHTLPITSTAMACDDIAEEIAKALDGWMRPSAPSLANDDRVVVHSGPQIIPDKDFLIWRVGVRVRVFF